MVDPAIQERSFVDLYELDSWSQGYLIQLSSPCSYVLSACFPDGNSVDNTLIAPFRTKSNANVLRNKHFWQEIHGNWAFGFAEKMQNWDFDRENGAEEEYVQIYAGYLPVEVSKADYSRFPIYNKALCGFYRALPHTSPAAVNRVWPVVLETELCYLDFPGSNVHNLLDLHMKSIAEASAPLCIVASFPVIRPQIGYDLTCPPFFSYSWETYSRAAKAHMTYSINTVNMREAICRLSDALLAFTHMKFASPDWLLEELPRISTFFGDFPEYATEKAVILNYLLTVFIPPASEELLMELELLDEGTISKVCELFPLSAVNLVKFTEENAYFCRYMERKLPTFPAFCVNSLEKLLDNLPFEEEYKVCRMLRRKPLLLQLESRHVVQKSAKR